jgi:hypothetical protein
MDQTCAKGLLMPLVSSGTLAFTDLASEDDSKSLPSFENDTDRTGPACALDDPLLKE